MSVTAESGKDYVQLPNTFPCLTLSCLSALGGRFSLLCCAKPPNCRELRMVVNDWPIADVVFVVEGTANLSPYVDSIKSNYILPTLE